MKTKSRTDWNRKSVSRKKTHRSGAKLKLSLAEQLILVDKEINCLRDKPKVASPILSKTSPLQKTVTPTPIPHFHFKVLAVCFLILLFAAALFIPFYNLGSHTNSGTTPENQGLFNFFTSLGKTLTGAAISIDPVEQPVIEPVIEEPAAEPPTEEEIIITPPLEEPLCYNQTTCLNETITTCENVTSTSCTECSMEQVCTEECIPSCWMETINNVKREVCTSACETICVEETTNCTEECLEVIEENCTIEIVESCTVE
ncbi:MAG: hypothetical protein KKH52_04075, partial [Nanoarchaeota archaeon]|nr:hypothetical protein [Nanoarchaeota archaeon]